MRNFRPTLDCKKVKANISGIVKNSIKSTGFNLEPYRNLGENQYI